MQVLIVDDQPSIRRVLRDRLERNGYQVTEAEDGETGIEQVARFPPDVVILELVLPRLDGLEVCRRLREWSAVPVIILSARRQERDKVAALDAGADDYLTKPFSFAELLARIRSVTRRAAAALPRARPATFRADGLVVDFARRRVTVDDREVRLTPKEYDLLRVLVTNAGCVMTQDRLLSEVWGAKSVEDRHTLRVHIANLRDKIEPDRARSRYILTEPRVGYRFRAAS
jgi:two-component system KDP operon response regulator KdpE